MAKSSKAISRMVTSDVDKALANISASTPKPDMSGSDSELKSAVAPQKAPSFAEAFRAARAKAVKEGRDPSKETFMWGGQKKVARMAGEGASRPAAAPRRSGTGSTGSTTPTSRTTSTSGSAPAQTQTRSRATSDWASSPKAAAALAAARSRTGTAGALAEGITRRNKLTPAAPKPGLIERYRQYMLENTKSPNAAEIQTRLKTAAAQKKAAEEAKQRKASEEAKKATSEYERRTGKSILTRAKGGSVDGCAIRGKTRAMKKGK